jgi:hypothetical protein
VWFIGRVKSYLMTGKFLINDGNIPCTSYSPGIPGMKRFGALMCTYGYEVVQSTLPGTCTPGLQKGRGKRGWVSRLLLSVAQPKNIPCNSHGWTGVRRWYLFEPRVKLTSLYYHPHQPLVRELGRLYLCTALVVSYLRFVHHAGRIICIEPIGIP